MATDNCVTKLIKKGDFNVKLTCFDDDSTNKDQKEVFQEWFQTIWLSLDNFHFENKLFVVRICTVSETLQVTYARSTEDVQLIILECFDEPQTFRLDIMTPHETNFSWIFVLSKDL